MRLSPPVAIVASDLERASETAKIVSAAAGVPVELDAGLREVDVGSWTGKSYEEVKVLFAEEWAAWETGLDLRRGGGETYEELAERIDRALGRIATRYSDASATVLVVSHGGAIKGWISRLLGLRASGSRALVGMANASLTLVEHDAQGRHRVHCWNDTAHLEGMSSRDTPTARTLG
jgi:probable phosphoglycerate mutase